MGEHYRDELGNAMVRAERAEARVRELEPMEERALAAEAEVARLRGGPWTARQALIVSAAIGAVVTLVSALGWLLSSAR